GWIFRRPLHSRRPSNRAYSTCRPAFRGATNMKILIVEDNPQMRQLIRSFVEDLAEEIVECGDGEEAVAVYAAHQFGGDDGALMDLRMPRLGGLEATWRLRAAFPEAQIIIVTQYDDPHWRAHAATCSRGTCSTCGGCCKPAEGKSPLSLVVERPKKCLRE